MLNGRPLSRCTESRLAIRTSVRVPCGTRMVGPGKIPLYPAMVVSRPGTMLAWPSFWVSR